jgi:hypothetical protein
MLLKIKRAQKSSMMGSAVFALDFRAEVSREERDLIDKYKLGKDIIYSSENFRKNAVTAATATNSGDMLGIAKSLTATVSTLFNLKISTNDLINGKHVEMKDLGELLSAEEQVVTACNNLKAYLAAARTFDGREDTIEI